MEELLGKLGIDWRLLIAQAVNFLIVLFLLKKFVFGKIIAFLEERRKKIAEGVELAEKASREMDRVTEARKRGLELAKEEASALLAIARGKAEEHAKAAVLGAQEKAREVLERARTDGKKEREGIVAESKQDVSRMVVMATEKVLGRRIGERESESLAREALEYIEKEYAK